MRTGFSLVELSIVLVILGLLTGGILAGQSLIRAAELRSVSTDYQRYVTAVQAFRDRYFALPGDMANATKFWGAAHATPATCLTTVGTGTQTCNGDGDGQVEWPAAVSQYGEMFTFWQQLANAGLIEANYTGIAGPGGLTDRVVGQNTPGSKLSSADWSVWHLGNFTADGWTWTLNFGHTLNLTNDTTGKILKPEEAWNIDKKLDDGKPAQGKVLGTNYTECTNAVSGTDYNADYDLFDTSIVCMLVFRQVF